MKKLIKSNIKLIIGILIGMVLSITTVYAATILFASSQVSYDNTSSGMSATNVQDALDELYTKANTWIDPSYIDFTTLATNTNKTILASKNGICIKRNNKVSCFKIKNWATEQTHIQKVFSDVSCSVDSSYVGCDASDFFCSVDSGGSVVCLDAGTNEHCFVDGDGSVYCR